MKGGILDDIIDSLNMSKPTNMATLNWALHPESKVSTQQLIQSVSIDRQPQQQQIQQQQVPSAPKPYVPQQYQPKQSQLFQQQQQYIPQQQYAPVQQQPLYIQARHNINVQDEIYQLQQKLQQLSVPELSVAHKLLSELTQSVEQTIRSYKPIQINQQNKNVPVQSYNQVSQPDYQELYRQEVEQPVHQLLEDALPQQKQQKYAAKPLQFPRSSVYDKIENSLQGINAIKIQKVTSEASQKFFWVQDTPTGYKLLWSNQQGEPATGSMSLSTVQYLLVGGLSQQFIKCRVKVDDLKTMKKSTQQPVSKQITLIGDKKDVTIQMGSMEDIELWTAAFEKFGGAAKILVSE
ncbi:Conserved_hypothetical protein [Hexamita inflata]|uniref:Uncharacterized protein n=1 Tax=Hexamita inflata TaxID=28002 RepID=A0AA86NBR0_9EUKA|nr:Conserved hypothetical protein [Hexamita inflata]